jgi:hypothetical protein
MNPVALLALLALLVSSPLNAQLQPPRGAFPAPAERAGDPYEALSFFEGNWTIDGLPDGVRFDEACTWLSTTHRHLVCRSRTESRSGVQEGLAVFSYRASDGMYVYRSFDPNGAVDELEGRRNGELWQFAGLSGTGSAQRRTRLTITPGGERSFRLMEEVALGNGAFQSQPEVHYVPSVPPSVSR